MAVVKGMVRAQQTIDDFANICRKRKRNQESSFSGNTRCVGSVEDEPNIEEGELKGAMIAIDPLKLRFSSIFGSNIALGNLVY